MTSQIINVNNYVPIFAPKDFEFSSDAERVDRSRVYEWLNGDSYWATTRSRSQQDAAMDGSRNFGIYRADSGTQVAYARVVTDGATFAWLCDVYVERAVRGIGVGTALVGGTCATLDGLGLTRILLATADAHGLYRRFGFEPLGDPAIWMAKASFQVAGAEA
ncbi:GNAT family N-acetyltransferase [Arthrobacter sp. CAN_C5]|uniref:GNAT family N-acetyltransferase n=1 Tax=Arthrobacter sp. CAN_C5 TaxID=2760706 RepID=UPI001AE90DF0|nr:GNAT family N-acetyltransferase [Arthrobacter sp. CAN_C5]